MIGLYRKCHKSDHEAQVDWPVGALRRVGKIVRIIQAHSGDKWEKNFLSELCVYVHACMHVLFLYFVCFIV